MSEGLPRERAASMIAERYDIAVVGAGPCGLAVGVAARRVGASCVLIDKGCITRSITLFPQQMRFFSTPERLEIGGVPFTSVNDKPMRREALHYYRRIVGHFGLEVRQYEAVTEIEGAKGDWLLRTELRDGSERELRAGNVVVHHTDDPEVIIAEFDYHGQVSTTGRSFQVANIQVLRVRDGQIVSSRDYHNHAAIAAVLSQ